MTEPISDSLRGGAQGSAPVPLSVLDLVAVGEGRTAKEALSASQRLARLAESRGFLRYWVAEHHSMPGISSSSPAVILAHLAAHTETLRLGSGGVMLPNHAPHLAVDLPGGAIDHSDQVFADGKIYISGSGAQEIGEDAWGVVPRDKAQAHYLLRAPLNDPEHVLQQIAAMREISRQGEENVQGVRTVRYRGILDHRTVTLRMAPDVRTKADQARDALGSDLPVFADAWVDGRGRLVQTRMSVNLSGARVMLTMALSDIGEPVRVTVPRAADTIPVTKVGGILNG